MSLVVVTVFQVIVVEDNLTNDYIVPIDSHTNVTVYMCVIPDSYLLVERSANVLGYELKQSREDFYLHVLDDLNLDSGFFCQGDNASCYSMLERSEHVCSTKCRMMCSNETISVTSWLEQKCVNACVLFDEVKLLLCLVSDFVFQCHTVVCYGYW